MHIAHAEVQVTAIAYPIEAGLGTETAVPTEAAGYALDHQPCTDQLVRCLKRCLGPEGQLELGGSVLRMKLKPIHIGCIQRLEQGRCVIKALD